MKTTKTLFGGSVEVIGPDAGAIAAHIERNAPAVDRPPKIEAYAMAAAGEQACDWAYGQIAQFKPGANYRRLKALQTAGEALKEKPALYAAAPELLEALATAAAELSKFPDMGGPMLDAIRAAIAKAKGSQ